LDLKTRNASRRVDEVVRQLVRPIIQLNTKKSITCIKWNPDNEDQLAVSYLNQSTVSIFNLSRSPPSSVHLTDTRMSNRVTGSKSLLFVSMKPLLVASKRSGKLRLQRNTRLLVGSGCGIVCAWSLPHAKQRLLWSVQAFSSPGRPTREGVADMVLLGQDYRDAALDSPRHYAGLLLLGGTNGTVELLDTQKCTKKSFSTSPTPTFLRRWILPSLLRRQFSPVALPPAEWLGVHQLAVWQHPSPDPLRNALVSVVTHSGWVLRLSLTDSRLAAVHKTRRVASFNSTGAWDERHLFCLPETPCPGSALGSGLLCVADVGVKRIVRANDPKIAEVLLRETRSHALLLLDADDYSWGDDAVAEMEVVSRVELPSAPRVIAVHPDGEWIVVGYGDGVDLELLSVGARSNPPRETESKA